MMRPTQRRKLAGSRIHIPEVPKGMELVWLALLHSREEVTARQAVAFQWDEPLTTQWGPGLSYTCDAVAAFKDLISDIPFRVIDFTPITAQVGDTLKLSLTLRITPLV